MSSFSVEGLIEDASGAVPSHVHSPDLLSTADSRTSLPSADNASPVVLQVETVQDDMNDDTSSSTSAVDLSFPPPLVSRREDDEDSSTTSERSTHLEYLELDQIELDPILDEYLGYSGQELEPDKIFAMTFSDCSGLEEHIPTLPDDDHTLITEAETDEEDTNSDASSLLSTSASFEDIDNLCSDLAPDSTIVEANFLDECHAQADPLTHALYGMSPQLRELKVTSRLDVYKLHRENSLEDLDQRAHIDGGSQATTTNDLSLLWHFKYSVEPLPPLAVADAGRHQPVGVGYLRVPVQGGDKGYEMVRCYYTPTLPVTILSPDRMCHQYGCRGHTSITTLGEKGSLELWHCRRRRENVLLPATVYRGLLYSDMLLLPHTKEERTGPLPTAVLHVSLADPAASPSARNSHPCSGNCQCPSTASTCLPPSCSDATCGSCTTPSLSTISADPPDATAGLYQKVLQLQRLGYQTDIDVDRLADYADGVPSWPPDTPHVCPHEPPFASSSDDPSASPPNVTDLLLQPDDRRYLIHHLTRDQQRILWHQRLGHIHSRRVSDTHRYATGVPAVPIATELDKCPVCAHAKLQKAARGTNDSRKADRCYQGISIDYGIIVQKSSADSGRVKRLQGLHGETCYCLIVDHHSGTVFGECFTTKAPPLDFLDRWLRLYGLPHDVEHKYVRMDLGGELGANPAIRELFNKAGYQVEPTAPMSSNQNGPGERPHQTISTAIRAILGGAGLSPRFWPYAFHHFLRLYNVTVHGDASASPYEICSGKRPDLRLLRVFGCRVYVLPPKAHRSAAILSDARTGIFLGYTKTMRNILYYDTESEQVKTAQHVAFDESMNDMTDKPPNARLLDGLKTGDLQIYDAQIDVPDLEVTASPFTAAPQTITVSTDFDSLHPLGLEFQKCTQMHRAYMYAVHRLPTTVPPGTRRGLRSFKNAYLHSYVVSVHGERVFDLQDVEQVLARLAAQPSPPSEIELVLVPERATPSSNKTSPMHLRLHDLRRICALRSVSGKGISPAAHQARIADYMADMSNTEMTEVIHRLQNSDMTDEERKLKSFTRRRLQQLPNWPLWDDAFDSQLDGHHKDKTFGLPVPRPVPKPGERSNVLRMHWMNVVKPGGKRKCRSCIDGSRRAAPWLREFAQTYASCISQPGMRTFFALSAATGKIITFADTTNAFQQSPPPSKACYLEIDDAYASWYLKRHGTVLNRRTHVIPVLHALQGHPEAGALWEKMIVGILVDELKFQATTHERNLYRGTLDGEDVLICRQVDDFAVGSRTTATAEKLISLINRRVTTKSLGVGTKYNGVDILQTRDYVKLSCESYIDRLLQTHGWDQPGAREPDRFDSVPMTADTSTTLQGLHGPADGTAEHKQLEATMKFNFRQVLGELIYAYVVARVDIGHAVTLLSRFSTNPHAEHYTALKNVCRYLRRTKSWGIIYWRPEPLPALPTVPLDIPPTDDSLPVFPRSSLLQLVGFVDAAHATDLHTRRSVTGLSFCLAGGAVAYKTKLQATVATSSTEAEFVAAVDAAKVAKSLRTILAELGYPQHGPTPLYEDNQAAIAMINETKPTARSRHIDIQHFAIQEWRARGLIEMRYIPTTINPADAATKCLAWTLLSRHIRRLMGHYGHP